MSTQKKIRRRVIRTSLLTGLVLLLPLAAGLAQAQQKDDCQAQLFQAENEYRSGGFDKALTLINDCLNKGNPTEADRQRALKLQILVYIAKDYIEQAKVAINKLLDLVPNYEPDPAQDKPEYINIFEQVKQERNKPEPPAPIKEVKQKKGGGAKWLLIGGGVVVAGVGAALALGGGGTTPPPPGGVTTLPTPPPLP